MNTESVYFYIHREGRSIMSSITVSNPYSFNISKNTGFSCLIQVILPNDKQSLFSDSEYAAAGSSASIEKTIELKIPNGVNVIYVEACANASSDDLKSINEGTISVTNIENNKKWASESNSVMYDDLVLDVLNYIGVTPGKIYKLKIVMYALAELDPGRSDVFLNISYSAFINQQAPTVTDY